MSMVVANEIGVGVRMGQGRILMACNSWPIKLRHGIYCIVSIHLYTASRNVGYSSQKYLDPLTRLGGSDAMHAIMCAMNLLMVHAQRMSRTRFEPVLFALGLQAARSNR